MRSSTTLLSRFLILGICFFFIVPAYALSDEEAIRLTQSQLCKAELTIDQALAKTIKSRSQRDLGWRTFSGPGFIDVERAVLINKGMELRFRWRVEEDGAVGPENERAERLCSE